MLIAANFRKEVTSTVLWLSSFKLRIQCFKASPFSQGDDLFLTIDQIIPMKDTEDFMIGLATKAQTEVEGFEAEKARHALRRDFWAQLLPIMNERSPLFQNISPRTTYYVGVSSGTRGINFTFVATGEVARVEVYIDTGTDIHNKTIFDSLQAHASEISENMGYQVVWEPLDGKRACRIKVEQAGNINDREQWPAMINFMVDAMIKLDQAFRNRLVKISSTSV